MGFGGICLGYYSENLKNGIDFRQTLTYDYLQKRGETK